MSEILGVRFVFDEEKISRKRDELERLYNALETQITAKTYSELEEEIIDKEELEGENPKDLQQKMIERLYYEFEQGLDNEALAYELRGKIENTLKKEAADAYDTLDDELKYVLTQEIEKRLVDGAKKQGLIEHLRKEKAAKKDELDMEKMRQELDDDLAEQGVEQKKWLLQKVDENSYHCKNPQDFVRLYRFVSKNLKKFKDFLKDKEGCLWLEEGLEINLLKKGTIAPTAIQNYKSMAISLREDRLKEFFTDTSSPYRLLDIFLLDKSFKFRASIKAYRSTRSMSFYEVAFVMDALLERFAWLGKCMKGFVVQDLRG